MAPHKERLVVACLIELVALLAGIAGPSALSAQATARQRTLPRCTVADARNRARLGGSDATGRYVSGDAVLFLASCGPDSLAVSPAHFGSIEYALRVGPDSFTVVDRPSRTVRLLRNADGALVAAVSSGFGLPARLERLPAKAPATLWEHILFDRRASDIATALSDASNTARSLAPILDRAASRFPSRIALLANALGDPRLTTASDTALLRLQIDLLARSGRVALARSVATASDTTQVDPSLRALLTEGVSLPDTGWKVPFALEALFRTPRADEVAATRRRIDARRRDPGTVDVVARHALVTHGDSFEVLILGYSSTGGRQVGAVVRPLHPPPSCCGTIVSIKGTAPNYPPLDLRKGTVPHRLLGTAARAYIVLLPAIRGEVLQVDGASYTASGDRRDGWDGGAEDAISLLAAAATIDSRIRPERSCAWGHSRGGAVALLVGSRLPKLGCVIAIAPPVDWFEAMWADGWPAPAILSVGIRQRATPEQAGGQFIERFLAPVVEGRWSLDSTRSAMIASSPRFWVAGLPPTLAVFGAEDASVPERNGGVLGAALRGARKSSGSHRVLVLPMAGHDTDPALLASEIPRFLARWLGTPIGRRLPGADAR